MHATPIFPSTFPFVVCKSKEKMVSYKKTLNKEKPHSTSATCTRYMYTLLLVELFSTCKTECSLSYLSTFFCRKCLQLQDLVTVFLYKPLVLFDIENISFLFFFTHYITLHLLLDSVIILTPNSGKRRIKAVSVLFTHFHFHCIKKKQNMCCGIRKGVTSWYFIYPPLQLISRPLFKPNLKSTQYLCHSACMHHFVGIA